MIHGLVDKTFLAYKSETIGWCARSVTVETIKFRVLMGELTQ